MALEKELATYDQALPNLKGQEGKYVLIKDESLIGVYDTYQDALKEGYDRFKLDPFLVKQVRMVENVQFFTRELTTCPT